MSTEYKKPWHIIDYTTPSICGGGNNLHGGADDKEERNLPFIVVDDNNILIGSFCSRGCAEAFTSGGFHQMRHRHANVECYENLCNMNWDVEFYILPNGKLLRVFV